VRDLVGYFWTMIILKKNAPSGWKTVFQSREWNESEATEVAIIVQWIDTTVLCTVPGNLFSRPLHSAH
jgi:hypothetical protein